MKRSFTESTAMEKINAQRNRQSSLHKKENFIKALETETKDKTSSKLS